MTRRTKGPLRSAEAYASRTLRLETRSLAFDDTARKVIAAAWMAGYNSGEEIERLRRKRDAPVAADALLTDKERAVLREILDERKGPK